MSGESSTEEVLEGVVVGPNVDGVLVMGLESHVDDDFNSSVVEASQFESGFDGSGDKDAAAVNDDSGDQDSSYVQVDRVETSNDSLHSDSDDVKTTDEAGKEDMFVDAPDELGASAQATNSEETTERIIEGTQFYEEGGMQSYQLVDEVGHQRTTQSTLEKVNAETSALYREKQEERVSSVKEIADIQCQIKALDYSLVGEHNCRSVENPNEGEEETSGTEIPFSKYVRECSESLKQALERHLQSEEEINELHDRLNTKDKEIDDLKAKISNLSLSQESQEEISRVQKQNYLYADAVMNQLLTSLSTVVYQGNLVDDSVGAKAAMVESSLSVLIQNYNQIVYDIEQLRQSLRPEADARKEDYRTVLSATRDELMVLRAKEEELMVMGKCNQLEEELANIKPEFEQEKAKSGNLREKLSLAITKGKSLVQQRDSLRQSLAEKTCELDDCLVKLKDTSRALAASEHRIVELVACENMLTSLQESISFKDENLAQQQFTVKGAYDILTEEGRHLRWPEVVWNDISHPKHSFCTWLAFRDRLPTKDRLGLRGELGNCVWCKSERENSDHVFLSCPEMQVINKGLNGMGMANSFRNWKELMSWILNYKWRNKKERLKTLFMINAAVFEMWRNRNALIFKEECEGELAIAERVRRMTDFKMDTIKA